MNRRVENKVIGGTEPRNCKAGGDRTSLMWILKTSQLLQKDACLIEGMAH